MFVSGADIKSRPRRPGDFHAQRCMCGRPGCVAITIVQADPYVHIAPAIIESARAGQAGEWVRYDGDVLTIRGRNRTVAYRIIGPAPSWPDGTVVVFEAERVGD